MPDYVWPQDEGTGVPEDSEDYADAANFASAEYDPNSENFIVEGLTVTANGDGTIDVAAGKARITASSLQTEDHGSGADTRNFGCGLNVEAAARSSVTLPNSAGMNYVFLHADVSVVNDVSIIINSTGTDPSGHTLKIAEVDDSTDTVTMFNQRPDGTYADVDAETISGDVANSNTIQNLVGANLSVDGSGNLNANSGSSNTELSNLTVTNWNWVDLQEKNVSSGGGADVSTDVESYIADNTIILFPPGTYLVTAGIDFTGTDASNIIFLGMEGAVIKSAANSNPLITAGTNADPVKGVRFVNLRFNYQTDQAGGNAIKVRASERCTVEDCRVEGATHENPLTDLAMTATGAVGVVDRWRAPNGAESDFPGSGPSGLYISSDNKGVWEVKDALIKSFPNNGLHVDTGQTGFVTSIGGKFTNNNKGNISMADGAVYQPQITIDALPNYGSASTDQIGIDFTDGFCEVHGANIVVDNSATGIEVDAAVTGGVVSSTEIRFDSDGYAMDLAAPSGDNDGFSVKDTFIRGNPSASGQTYSVNVDRPYTRFNDCSVDVNDTGAGSKKGIQLNGEYCSVNGGFHRADDTPIRMNPNAGTMHKVLNCDYIDNRASNAEILIDAGDNNIVKNNTYANSIQDNATNTNQRDNVNQ